MEWGYRSKRDMYDILAGRSETKGGWVRLLVLPVAATEVVLEVAILAAHIAERIIKALANILGSLFCCDECKFGQGVAALFSGVVMILIASVLVPISIPLDVCGSVVFILYTPQKYFSGNAIRNDRSLSKIKGEDWYSTLRGQSWLTTPAGLAWLETTEGVPWRKAPISLEWLTTPTGNQWLESQNGETWREKTAEGGDWLKTAEGMAWLSKFTRSQAIEEIDWSKIDISALFFGNSQHRRQSPILPSSGPVQVELLPDD